MIQIKKYKHGSDNVDAVVRQVKIDLITDKSNYIIDFFNSIFEVPKSNTYYHNKQETFYCLGTDRVFYHNIKDNSLICSHYNYWCYMSGRFYMNDQEIASVTKLLFDNKFNTDVETPVYQTTLYFLTD